MTTKHRLITDSFKVVKKARKGGKRDKRPTPPPPHNGEVRSDVLYLCVLGCLHCICMLHMYSIFRMKVSVYPLVSRSQNQAKSNTTVLQ